jgi:hypothetical protein
MPGRLQSPPDSETDRNVREYILTTLEAHRKAAITAGEKAGKSPREIQRMAWDAGSQDALARAIGMHPSAMSRRITGLSPWPFQADEIKRMAELWGVTADEIMNGPAREEGD